MCCLTFRRCCGPEVLASERRGSKRSGNWPKKEGVSLQQQRLIVLGATGSVGESTAEVVLAARDRVGVDGLVAHRSGERLWKLGRQLEANWVGLTDQPAARALAAAHGGEKPRVVAGLDAIVEAIQSSPADRVMSAMSGFSGLVPTLAAIERGMDVLLANKETLVAAGELVIGSARQSGSRIIPVDSEHSAIFQCLANAQPPLGVILTCSGGPFRGRRPSDLAGVEPAEALNHPTWNMGPKITIDTATLMNKGLEIIEAHWLFGLDYARIRVIVHPESIVHSMVEFEDGVVMAQLGVPDMRVPIEVAMAWPERWAIPVPHLSLAGRSLTFEPPDEETFPALTLARAAGEAGGLYPCALNAANEIAVEEFLAGRISFLNIATLVQSVLEAGNWAGPADSLEAVLECDARARAAAVSGSAVG